MNKDIQIEISNSEKSPSKINILYNYYHLLIVNIGLSTLNLKSIKKSKQKKEDEEENDENDDDDNDENEE